MDHTDTWTLDKSNILKLSVMKVSITFLPEEFIILSQCINESRIFTTYCVGNA